MNLNELRERNLLDWIEYWIFAALFCRLSNSRRLPIISPVKALKINDYFEYTGNELKNKK